MTKKPIWILIVSVCIIALITAGILILGIREINQYRAGVLPIHPASGHPQVVITSPGQNTQYTLGGPLIIQVEAFHPQKTSSVELYIEGEFVSLESAPSGGSNPFIAEFLWFPSAAGEYSLIARAMGVDGLSTYSPPVEIKISPPEYDSATEEIPDLGPAGQANPNSPPEYPSPEIPTNPGQEWKGSPWSWLTSLTAANPPVAPELAVAEQDCTAKLFIHDLSDNEEGFEIWRLLPGSPTWKSIAIIDSQSQTDWITFSDQGAFGNTNYYVSAFNQLGSRESNLVQVNLDPASCSPAAVPRSVLSLKLQQFQTKIPVDKLYCYMSLDGVYWTREPTIGFWPGEGAFETELMALDLTEDDSSSGVDLDSKSLYLQCWGWQGSALQNLGEIQPVRISSQKDTYQVDTEGFSALFSLNLIQKLELPDFYPMNEEYDTGPEVGIYDQDMMIMHQVIPIWQKKTVNQGMPFITAMIRYNPETCKNHLPPGKQNAQGQAEFCGSYPGFDTGIDGANPQPYFLWGVNQVPMCPNGQGEDCIPYDYWLFMAASQNHEVGFDVYDINNKGYYQYQFTTPYHFAFALPPVPCSGTRQLWAQMWYYDGTTLLPIYGPPSNKVSIPCPYQLGDKMLMDIRFDEIKFSNLEDDDSGSQTIEAYGYLQISSDSVNRYQNLATWQGGALPIPGAFGELQTFGNGIYSFSDLQLCKSNSYLSCSETGWDTNNNITQLTITEGDSLTIHAKVIDKDYGFGDDLVCEGTYQIPGQSIFEWYKIKNQVFAISGSPTSSGSCQIKFTLHAVDLMNP